MIRRSQGSFITFYSFALFPTLRRPRSTWSGNRKSGHDAYYCVCPVSWRVPAFPPIKQCQCGQAQQRETAEHQAAEQTVATVPPRGDDMMRERRADDQHREKTTYARGMIHQKTSCGGSMPAPSISTNHTRPLTAHTPNVA